MPKEAVREGETCEFQHLQLRAEVEPPQPPLFLFPSRSSAF